MTSLKSLKTLFALVLLGIVAAWMGCSDSAPVASRPAGKATCSLCEFLGDDAYTATDGLPARESPDTTQTDADADADADSTQTDADADSTQSAIVEFADANLERAVREALDRPQGALTPADLAALTELDASYKNIESVAGLEHATALTTLYLRGNAITDVQPLASLTNLQTLSLWGNKVADASPLASLISLRTLDMWGNEITDVQPFAGLTNLQFLNLGDNDIADVSPLASLTNLQWLGVMENALSQHAANQQLAAAITSGLRVEAVLEKYPRVETVQVYPEEPDEGQGAVGPALYVTDGDRNSPRTERRSKIWRVSLDGSVARSFIPLPRVHFGHVRSDGRIPRYLDGSNPNGIAVDVANRKIYWADAMAAGSIRRSNLDGSDTLRIASNLGSPQGVALDLVNRKIYWTDQNPGAIGSANLDDPPAPTDIITSTLNTPTGIAVDAERGKIYWTDWVLNKIESADLDGSNRQDFLANTNTNNASGVALDLVNRKIYWVSWTMATGTRLQRADLDGDGSDAEVVTPAGVTQLWGIAVDAEREKIYWVDQNGSTFVNQVPGDVGSANLDGSNPRVLLRGLMFPKYLALGVW